MKRKYGPWSKLFLFDVNKERKIYRYLCREVPKIKQKKIKDYQFDSYKEWKNYIIEKYEAYSSESLNEFSRFLNYELEKRPGITTFLVMYYSALLSVIFSVFLTIDAETNIRFIVELLLICAIAGIAIKMIMDAQVEKLFYKDYKEVIDELICVKEVSEL